MEKTVERVGYLKLKPNFLHLFIGLVLMIFALILQFLWIGRLDNPTMVALVTFNLLFVFLLFPLDGSLFQKFILLISGNFVGILWYILQIFFEQTFFFTDLKFFRILVLLVKPLTDFMWLVVFWSFSLSIFSSKKLKVQRRIKD